MLRWRRRAACEEHGVGNSLRLDLSTKLHTDIQTDKVTECCRRHRIWELSLFVSGLRDDFLAGSDVDAPVDLAPNARHSVFDLVQMEEEPSVLFERKVDLVEQPRLRKPFRRYEILRTRQVIFAA